MFLWLLMYYWIAKDCKKPVMGKTFYCIEGKPACPKCAGAEEEDE